MSSGWNLRRFEQLERERETRTSEASAAPVGSARFESLEIESGAPPVPVAPEPALERFEAPVDRSLELRDTRAEGQPFTRCASCEGDNSRYVNECARCGARLDTPEQRAFNEALWAQRREVQAAEQTAQQAVNAAREAVIEEEARAKRAFYESLARQVRAETEARIDGQHRPSLDLLRVVGRVVQSIGIGLRSLKFK